MKERLHTVATNHGFPVDTWYRAWAHTGNVTENPMGVDWIGLVMGLGFVLSFGYWVQPTF